MSLKIYTLGRLTIELDGESLSDFVSQKAPALFVYLLHHPREHERDVLAELFWNDTSSEQALKNLRTVLSNLQKSLGAYLDVSRQTLAIAQAESIWLDSRDFSQAIAAINERQQQPHSPRRLLGDLDKALGIYQGDFLLGLKTGGALELDTWLSLERESLRGKLLKALYLGMELALAQGDYGRGIGYGGRLLALDPFYERGLRLQMRFHAYADNRNAALQAYDSFAKLLQKELAIDPEEETIALAKAIKIGRIVALAPLAKPNNLYRPNNRYTGNAVLVAQANSLLDEPNCRLVTFLGAGGIGKTRLAEHIAHERLDDYRDGIFFVPLASVNAPDAVIQAIFQALGVLYTDSRRKPLDALLEALRDKQLLLILDNFEHVLEAADLVAELLRRLPFLQILVTSREALQLQGEYLLMMQTLAYQSGSDMAAMQLFAQMAQRVQVDFSLEAHNEAIAQICALVDGLPLAIVIAAAWVQFLAPAAIVERIRESLDFLTVQRRDLPERHRGIAALLHSSWQALSPKEQQVLQALAVFAGHFDLEAAIAVSGTEADDLIRLVSKSLLQIHSEGRYQQHELLRRFVLEQGENPTARLALAHYFRDWAKRLVAEGRPIHEQFALIDREYPNIWRLEGLIEAEQERHVLSLCDILSEYWIARGYSVQEAIRRLEQALVFAEDNARYVRGLVRLGQMLAQSDRYEEAKQLLPRAIELSHELGDTVLEAVALNEYQRSLIAFGDFEGSRAILFQLVDLTEAAADSPQIKRLRGIAYTNLGTVHNQLNLMDEAVIFAQIGLELNEQTNNVLMRCLCHNVLGIVALERADFLKAKNEFAEALSLVKQVGHIRFETMFSGNLAEAVQKNGDFDAAYKIYCDTLLTAYRIENYTTVLNVLEQMANLALELHLGEASGILWGAAKQLREGLQLAIEPRQEPELNGIEVAIKRDLGELYAASLEKGRKLSLKDAVDYARMV